MLHDVGNNRDCDVDVDHRNNTSSALTGVGINTGEPQKLGSTEMSDLLGWEVWLHPRYMPLPICHMCYLVKFGSSVANVVCVNRKEPPEMGSVGTLPLWGAGMADHLKTSAFPICATT